MTYLFLKSLHIIFVITWFACLFYIVRLFIYHTEAIEKNLPAKNELSAQFKIMEKRLWNIIGWPSSLLTLLLGGSLLQFYIPVTDHPWLMAKLSFVLGLFIYHLKIHSIYKLLQNNQVKYTSTYLRYFNEVATVLLFVIVFLVVLKSMVGLVWGIVSIASLVTILIIATKVYQKCRASN